MNGPAHHPEARPARRLFDAKPIIGMIHLPALPGAPGATRSIDDLVEFATAEARLLEEAGLDAAILENAGDHPFFRTTVSAVTVAAAAVIARAVRESSSLALGVNLLRNACEQALSVAHATGADFIRCNVVIGAYVTDQGIVQGCAAELARLKTSLGSDVLVLGDVHVKHAHPLFDVPIADAACDLAERGGVDAVVVSGRRSPDAPDLENLRSSRPSSWAAGSRSTTSATCTSARTGSSWERSTSRSDVRGEGRATRAPTRRR